VFIIHSGRPAAWLFRYFKIRKWKVMRMENITKIAELSFKNNWKINATLTDKDS